MAFNTQAAKQAGYSDQEIQQYLASKQPAQPSPQPEKQGGGLLDGILPFIGGIGGSLVGAPLGPIGAIGGGAIGSGLGDLVRQLLGGHGVDAGSIGKEAAIGGVGGVAGEALSPLIRGGVNLATKGAAAGLDKAGSGFLSSQYNVPRTIARATKMGDTIEALSKYGVHNINDVTPAADIVTGRDGIISKGIRTAVSGAHPVDTTGIAGMAKNIAAHPSITGGSDKKFIDFVNAGLSAMRRGRKGSIAIDSDPAAVFDFIQQLEGHAADLTKGKSPALLASGDKALSKGYKLLADELKDRLYGGVRANGDSVNGADNAIAAGVFGPEELKQLAAIHPQLAMDVLQAPTVRDLRGISSHFVKGSQLADETHMADQLGFKNIGEQANGVAKLVPSFQDPLAPLRPILGSDAVNANAGKAFKGAAQGVRGLPTDNISRITAAMTGQGIGQGVGAASSMPDKAQAAEGQIVPPGGTPPLDATAQPQDPEARKQEILKTIIGQLMFSKAKSVGDLKTALDTVSPSGAAPKPPTDQQRRTMANAQSGLRALGNVESILGSDPNAPLKSKIPIVSGKSPYAAASREINDVLTRLRTGAALNQDEQKFYEKQLPQPFDSPSTVAYKLSIFKDLFTQLAGSQDTTQQGSPNDIFSLFAQ
jgi:hypothetical protein